MSSSLGHKVSVTPEDNAPCSKGEYLASALDNYLTAAAQMTNNWLSVARRGVL